MFDLLRTKIVRAPDDAALSASTVLSGPASDAGREAKAPETVLYGESGFGVSADTKDAGKETGAGRDLPGADKPGTDAASADAGLETGIGHSDSVPPDGNYTLSLGEGIELDAALLEKAAPVMKEIGLSNAQASKLANVLAEQRKAEYDALSERHQKVTEDWQKEIRTDKDFGGARLTASVNNANRVIATFGDDALRRDLVDIGIGNHPGIFRLLARVGNALSDDKPAQSETPAASRRSQEEIMYGATTPTTRG
jgi:hypothetical protein